MYINGCSRGRSKEGSSMEEVKLGLGAEQPNRVTSTTWKLCELCGKSSIWGSDCACYFYETKDNLLRMEGCLIEKTILCEDSLHQYVIQKLRPSSSKGVVFYLKICILDCGGQNGCWRKVREISEKEYSQYA